ncbi:MAG: hypothetical protein D6689_06245 [Deltaproteobacteria bacterium]|nr:MAG: hypothetical protein D6689_06245 [Deltaproteobacteria bacterium]
MRPRAAGAAGYCAAAIAVALAPACGGSVGRSPGWRAPRPAATATGEGRTSAGSAAAERLVFVPSGPPARAYGAPAGTAAPRGPVADAVVGAVARAAAAAGRPAPMRDPRLFAVAADLAPLAREDAPIPYALVEFALRYYGVVEPSPHLVLIWGPLDDASRYARQVEAQLANLFASTEVARVGVGSHARGRTGVILLILQPSFVDVDPVPRRVAVGEAIALRARVRPPYRDPHVFVTRRDGGVDEPRVSAGADGRVAARVACDDPGVLRIEIAASDARGSSVLANFPVWCGVAPPRTTSVAVPAGATDATAIDAERRLYERVDAARAAAGLPPLVRDERLAAIARAHSAEMRDTGEVAHVSPTTGTAADRVRAAGIATALVLENVARAYGVDEAHEGLMNSPGHRANILAREATHIGIGVAFGRGEAGERALFVTQLFIRIPPAVDPTVARARIRARIERRTRLRRDERLEAIAQRFARDVASGVPAERAAKRSQAALDRLAADFAAVTTIANAVADVDGFPLASVQKEASMTHFGVGIAQGRHPQIGDRALFVVVLVGQRR